MVKEPFKSRLTDRRHNHPIHNTPRQTTMNPACFSLESHIQMAPSYIPAPLGASVQLPRQTPQYQYTLTTGPITLTPPLMIR